MPRNTTINVLTISIWECGAGKPDEKYALVLDSTYGGCAIQLATARYKKQLYPKITEARKMLKRIPSREQFDILHYLWNAAKGTLT
jgi:hypothetical protein